jgi:DNA-binding MarR family transcriptional regulator
MAAFDIGKINDIIHGRMRLGIVAYLASAEVADFNELKSVLAATQGNLSVHLSKLEEAGYVEINKGYLGRKPLTQVRLTQLGRRAFKEYLAAMSKLIED